MVFFFAEFIFSFGILEGDILITGPCFCLGFAKIIFFLITPLPGFGDLFPFLTSLIFLDIDILLVPFKFLINIGSFLLSLAISFSLLLLFILITLLSFPLLLLRTITLPSFSLFLLFKLITLWSFSLLLLFILIFFPSFSLLLLFIVIVLTLSLLLLVLL